MNGLSLEEQLMLATQTVGENESTGVSTQQITQEPAMQTQVIQSTQNIVQPAMTIPAVNVPPMQTPVVEAQQQSLNDIVMENGIQTIQLGQAIQFSHLSKFKKLNIGEKARISLLNTDVGVAKVHYSEELGRFACFSSDTHVGRCCQDLGEPKIRFYMPVMVYPVMPNDVNQVIPGQHAELKVLVIWDFNAYNVISDTIKQYGPNVDFVLTGLDTYGKFDVRNTPNTLKDNFIADITDANKTWENYKSTAPTLVRQNMDETKYLTTLANLQASPNYANSAVNRY